MAARAVHQADGQAQEILEVVLQWGCHQEGELQGEGSGVASLASDVKHLFSLMPYACWDPFTLRSGGPMLKATQKYPNGFGRFIARKHVEMRDRASQLTVEYLLYTMSL